jgi:hypothetical protein
MLQWAVAAVVVVLSRTEAVAAASNSASNDISGTVVVFVLQQ